MKKRVFFLFAFLITVVACASTIIEAAACSCIDSSGDYKCGTACSSSCSCPTGYSCKTSTNRCCQANCVDDSGITKCDDVSDGCVSTCTSCPTGSACKTATNRCCIPSWGCTSWSACASGTHTRTCTDVNSCGTTLNKPAESESCSCTPAWSCTSWSACASGTHTRTCTDANSCGTNTGKPAESESCSCTPSWSCDISWSICSSGTQTRTCTDANSCGTDAGKPPTSQPCCTGSCLANACSSYYSCSTAVGSCSSGYCCTGTCSTSCQVQITCTSLGAQCGCGYNNGCSGTFCCPAGSTTGTCSNTAQTCNMDSSVGRCTSGQLPNGASCSTNPQCSSGYCVSNKCAACKNACTSGKKRCIKDASGKRTNSYYECGDWNSDGCTEWSTTAQTCTGSCYCSLAYNKCMSCGSFYTCVQYKCVAPTEHRYFTWYYPNGASCTIDSNPSYDSSYARYSSSIASQCCGSQSGSPSFKFCSTVNDQCSLTTQTSYSCGVVCSSYTTQGTCTGAGCQWCNGLCQTACITCNYDGTCDAGAGENCENCLDDCGCPTGKICSGGTCVDCDTDGGLNYLQQGTAGSTSTDSCPSWTQLTEYYCLSDGTVTSTSFSCPSLGDYQCTNGACVCSNVCSAGDKSCVTSTTYKECYYDSSLGCYKWSAPTNCPSGTCSGGNCVTCSETDASNDVNTFGSCIGANGNWLDACTTVGSSPAVNQYQCSGTNCALVSGSPAICPDNVCYTPKCPSGSGACGQDFVTSGMTDTGCIGNDHGGSSCAIGWRCDGSGNCYCPSFCDNDGTCESGSGETCTSCPHDCTCLANVCYTPTCSYGVCGQTALGPGPDPGRCDLTYAFYPSCSTPPCHCDGSGHCVGNVCPDGTCSPGENCGTCPADCGCGSQICCSGSCKTPDCTAGSCNDGKPCTTDVCNSAGTCSAYCSSSNLWPPGQTPSGCTGSTGCTGGGCHCDGYGNCVGNTCSDTDPSNDVLVPGTCTDAAGPHPDSCSGNVLTQYSCSGNSCVIGLQAACGTGYTCSVDHCALSNVDGATFVSQNVQNSMAKSSQQTVTVTMRNSGTTTWNYNYRLGSQNPQDNLIWGIGRVFLGTTETVAPGLSKTFSFTITAPSTPGTTNFQWRMVNEGVRWFGDYSTNVPISITDCDCSSGACCDGCNYKPSSYVCDNNYDPQYGCTGANCGDDVTVTRQNRYCFGTRSACDGTIVTVGGPVLYADCALNQRCISGQSSCVQDSACQDKCSPGPCCDSSTHPYQFKAAGTLCSSEKVCNGNSLCSGPTTCNAAGQCNQFSGCALCSSTTQGQCGTATGACLIQPGNDACEYTTDSTKCSSCNDYCSAAFVCTPMVSSGCMLSYNDCISIASNPKPNQKPDNPSQCLCHTYWTGCI